MERNIDIVAFSDTHTLEKQVILPWADIAICAGDVMNTGYIEKELIDFLVWYEAQPHPYKILVAGNHDRYMENCRRLFNDLIKYYPSIIYLENSGVNIAGLNIWGTPDTGIFYNWAFNKTSEQLTRSFNEIPNDTDILVSHGPAWNILDKATNNYACGSRELSNKIKTLPNLKTHIFGHIHESYGMLMNNTPHGNIVTHINCSVVNEDYQVVNKPVEITITHDN